MSGQLRELIDSVRTQLQADLDARLGTLADRHEEASAEARALLLSGVREIDAAQSVSDALTAIVRAAAREAPRAALFVGSGDPLEEWVVDGSPPMSNREQATVAIPLLLEGEQVAVLYGDDDNTGVGVKDWTDDLAVIASHGASRLACITATRTAQAMRWLDGGPATTISDRQTALKGWTTPANETALKGRTTPVNETALKGWTTSDASADEEEQAAKRYARLLVSEIKLYNESAVRTGREQRDLARRLAPEIDRARRLYEQRVAGTTAGREELFHNELVQTLAEGDRSLLN